jgi:hypothetical protein
MKFGLLQRALLMSAGFALLPACGGSVNTTPTAAQAAELSAAAGASGAYVYQMPTSGTFTGTLGIPSSNSTIGDGATVTLTSTATDPTGVQTASTSHRSAQSAAMNAPYDYFAITWSKSVTSPAGLDFTVTPPNGAPAAGTQYYEEVNDTSGIAGWQIAFAGPFISDGSTVTFHVPANVAFQPGHAYVMAAYTLPATPAGPIALSSSSVSLLGAGASNAKTVTASETGYTGAFTSTGTACAGIATIGVSGSTVTVTGVAAGSCTATISDSFSQTKSLSITVTTSGLSAN